MPLYDPDAVSRIQRLHAGEDSRRTTSVSALEVCDIDDQDAELYSARAIVVWAGLAINEVELEDKHGRVNDGFFRTSDSSQGEPS